VGSRSRRLWFRKPVTLHIDQACLVDQAWPATAAVILPRAELFFISDVVLIDIWIQRAYRPTMVVDICASMSHNGGDLRCAFPSES